MTLPTLSLSLPQNACQSPHLNVRGFLPTPFPPVCPSMQEGTREKAENSVSTRLGLFMAPPSTAQVTHLTSSLGVNPGVQRPAFCAWEHASIGCKSCKSRRPWFCLELDSYVSSIWASNSRKLLPLTGFSHECRSPSTSALFCRFPTCIRSEAEQPWREVMPTGDAGVAGSNLTLIFSL